MHDVAVLHYIILALDRELASLAHSSLRTVLHVVVVLDYLGADEALLEVGVDDAGTLRSLPALVVCPRLHLHLAGGDECLQVEQVVSLLDETVHAALLKAQLLKEHLLVLVSLERCDVLLGLRSDDEHLRTLVLCYLRNLLRVLVAALCRRLVYVAHVEHGLGGEQEEVVSVALLLLRLELYAACVLSFLQHLLVSLEHRHGYLGVLVVADGCYLRLLLQLRLYGLEVLQLQLGVDNLLVLNRVHNRATLAHDVVVVEAAQHVDDGVGLADVAEELVAQALALRRTLHESGDVYYLASCGHDATRVNYLGKLREAFVGNGDDAHVRLDCTEREVGCLRLSVREAVEKSGLAHVRESYDTTF